MRVIKKGIRSPHFWITFQIFERLFVGYDSAPLRSAEDV